jgi:hypothetical protein
LFARWRIWFYNESTIEMHELVWVSGNLNTWVWNRVVNPCFWACTTQLSFTDAKYTHLFHLVTRFFYNVSKTILFYIRSRIL